MLCSSRVPGFKVPQAFLQAAYGIFPQLDVTLCYISPLSCSLVHARMGLRLQPLGFDLWYLCSTSLTPSTSQLVVCGHMGAFSWSLDLVEGRVMCIPWILLGRRSFLCHLWFPNRPLYQFLSRSSATYSPPSPMWRRSQPLCHCNDCKMEAMKWKLKL